MNPFTKDPHELQLFDVVQADLGANHPAAKPFHIPPRERISTQSDAPKDEAAPIHFEPRDPTMIDFMTAPFFKRPPRDWEANPDFAAAFFGATATALTQLDAIDITGVREFLRETGEGTFRVDRDALQARPLVPCALWQWNAGPVAALQGIGQKSSLGAHRHTGVIINGGQVPVLAEANAAFEKRVGDGPDIDAWLMAQSVHKVIFGPDSARTLGAPASFHVGKAFETQIAPSSGSGKDARSAELQIEPLGIYALTMDAYGRPYPGSLVLLPCPAGDPAYDARQEKRLAKACLITQIAHAFVHAPETSFAPVGWLPYGGELEALQGRNCQAFTRLDLGDLPRVLNEEAFAKKDGLAAAMKMLARKWEAPNQEAK